MNYWKNQFHRVLLLMGEGWEGGWFFAIAVFNKYLFIILILKTVLNLNQATVNEFPVGS